MNELNQELTRAEINSKFSELLKKDDFAEVTKEVANIKAAYDEAHRLAFQKQEELFEKAQQEAKANATEEAPYEAEQFKFETDEDSHRFKELYSSFLEKKKEYKKAIEKAHEENFEAKTAIIETLKVLTEEELNNFGETFNRFKILQEEWKKIGDVNKARFQTLQTEYSHLIDKFFYNVNIHKGLQNYSFEKNSAEKKALIVKLEELVKNDSIIQLEHYIKLYQKEWDEIGPTFQEEWDKIKEAYWTNVNAVYGKIRDHYASIREAQKVSIAQKEALIVKAEEIFENLQSSDKPNVWNDLSNKLKELQQEWKKTGFSKKAKDQELWESFRNTSNQFFDLTKEKYNKLNEKRDVFEEKKNALIAKANELKTSTDWKSTTEKFLRLQQDWKKSGTVKPQKDQKLWNTFRAACNEFFDSKKEFFATMDDRQDDNLKQKKEFAKTIETAVTIEVLETEIAKWWAVGHVPKKAINATNTAFDKAVEAAAKNLKLEAGVSEKIIFDAKIASFKASENGEKLLENEKRYVKEQIDKIKNDINQFENNLSFFGESKGAQKLKEVVEKRVDEAKLQLNSWKNKMKQF